MWFVEGKHGKPSRLLTFVRQKDDTLGTECKILSPLEALPYIENNAREAMLYTEKHEWRNDIEIDMPKLLVALDNAKTNQMYLETILESLGLSVPQDWSMLYAEYEVMMNIFLAGLAYDLKAIDDHPN